MRNAAYASSSASESLGLSFIDTKRQVDDKLKQDDFTVSPIELGNRLVILHRYNQSNHSKSLLIGGKNASSIDSRNIITLEMLRTQLKVGQEEIWKYYGGPVEVSSAGEGSAGVPAWRIESNLNFRSVDSDLPAPNVIEPIQQQFRLDGDFSPSRKLVQYWIRGVEAYQFPHSPVNQVTSQKVTPDIQAEFARLVSDVLAQFFQQYRYSNEFKEKLYIKDRFPPQFQTDIVETFQIIPDECQEFLTLLLMELIDGLRQGISIFGDWGKLQIDDKGGIVGLVSNPFFAEDSSFKRAELIE